MREPLSAVSLECLLADGKPQWKNFKDVYTLHIKSPLTSWVSNTRSATVLGSNIVVGAVALQQDCSGFDHRAFVAFQCEFACSLCVLQLPPADHAPEAKWEE